MDWDKIIAGIIIIGIAVRCFILERRCRAQDQQINWMAERIASQSHALCRAAERQVKTEKAIDAPPAGA